MDWDILMPLGICVVLPVMIVWLVMRTRQNETNRKTEIMLKAIESGVTVNADLFKQRHETMTIKERLLKRLSSASVVSLIGVAILVICICMVTKNGNTMHGDAIAVLTVFMIVGGILLAIGLALFIVFFAGRKMLAKEMEAEVKSLEQK